MGLFSSLGRGISGFFSDLTGNGASANPWFGQMSQIGAGNMAADRQMYSPIATSGQNLFNYANPNYLSAVKGFSDYLKTDPFTDSYSAAQLAKSTAGLGADYGAAKANLASDAAARGLSDSSVAAGGDAAIEAARAGALAGARGNLAFNAIGQNQARQQALVDLMSGARGAGLGTWTGALGSMGGIDGSMTGLFTNAGLTSQGQADAQNRSWLQLLGGLGNAAGWKWANA